MRKRQVAGLALSSYSKAGKLSEPTYRFRDKNTGTTQVEWDPAAGPRT